MNTTCFEIALNAFDDVLDRLSDERNYWTTISSSNWDHPYQTVQTREAKVMFKDVLNDIKQVIFNEPATIVIFKDGSKVCVKCTKNDKFDKEVGLIYALVKRLYANDVDENGYMKATGLGERIKKILANAQDQKAIAEEKKQKKQKKASKKNSK